ncbi:hypothetical protein J2S49_000005 [Arcanobacterium wilhelmae]|uniref:Uncharacterized protein n=1 Tax=Arcanobacterium wilhelmae TaxID=1803177 RepID=A0ABT9N892_9ACTO|nr:hypothetical protein [Arcanobacterium wilhelmae]MDP9799929.1 hypothetical protein [Arcanobacterium wilhelmae]WFN91064.1 hypothetical protein P8A24_04240 [Arcanobacterium wilhelmae]
MSEPKPAVDPRTKLGLIGDKPRNEQISDLEDIHRALSAQLSKAQG